MNMLLPEIHPGEILREEFMLPLGLSQPELQAALGRSSGLAALIAENGPVTSELAEQLGEYFKIGAEFWLALQTDYDARKFRRRALRPG